MRNSCEAVEYERAPRRLLALSASCIARSVRARLLTSSVPRSCGRDPALGGACARWCGAQVGEPPRECVDTAANASPMLVVVMERGAADLAEQCR